MEISKITPNFDDRKRAYVSSRNFKMEIVDSFGNCILFTKLLIFLPIKFPVCSAVSTNLYVIFYSYYVLIFVEARKWNKLKRFEEVSRKNEIRL